MTFIPNFKNMVDDVELKDGSWRHGLPSWSARSLNPERRSLASSVKQTTQNPKQNIKKKQKPGDKFN